MKTKLESLGFTVRAPESSDDERRVQVYLDGYHVAWFRSHRRMSDEVPVFGMDIHFVAHKALSIEQSDALRYWLWEEMLEATVV